MLIHRLGNEYQNWTACAVKCAAVLLISLPIASAQSPATRTPISTVTLGPDQIWIVKTAQKISTRISFSEPIKEIICGDLYDPASGTGSFVIQRIEKDIFVKPILTKGISNMFVKAGEKGEYMYNFSLLIVPHDQAHLIVNVKNATSSNTVQVASRKTTESKPFALPILASINNFPDKPPALNLALPDLLPVNQVKIEELSVPPPILSNRRASAETGIVDSRAQREAVRRIKPEYPDDARRMGISGEVTVEVGINRKGDVTSAQVISGPGLLRYAAISAARMWKFTQAQNETSQSQETARITFNFRYPETNDGSESRNPNKKAMKVIGRRP